MNTRSGAPRAFFAVVSAVVIGGSSVALSACGTARPTTPYIDTSTDFAGPTAEPNDDGGFTITTPTSGWTVELDQTIESRYGVRAFATLTRPPANAIVAQALEPHELAVPHPESLPVALYLRVLDEDHRDVKREPYRLATTTTPRP